MGKWIYGSELNDLEIKPPKRKGLEYSYPLRRWYNNFLYCSNCLEMAYSDNESGEILFPFCPYCGDEKSNYDYGEPITVKEPRVKLD